MLAAAHPGLRLLRAYTRSSGGELAGRFDAKHLPSLGSDSAAWVCGPAGLVDAVRAHWEHTGIGVPLQTEQFTAPTPALPADDGEPYGEVCFTRSRHGWTRPGSAPIHAPTARGRLPPCRSP